MVVVGGGGVSSSAVAWTKQVVQLACTKAAASQVAEKQQQLAGLIFIGGIPKRMEVMVMTSCGMDALIILCNA